MVEHIKSKSTQPNCKTQQNHPVNILLKLEILSKSEAFYNPTCFCGSGVDVAEAAAASGANPAGVEGVAGEISTLGVGATGVP